MRWLLDEHIPGHTEAFLRRRGDQILRPPRGAPDRDVALLAIASHATLLTRDRDFLTMLPRALLSLIVVRIHPPIAEDMTDALRRLLQAVDEEWLRSHVVILHPHGYETVR